jgi:hypothetical protein
MRLWVSRGVARCTGSSSGQCSATPVQSGVIVVHKLIIGIITPPVNVGAVRCDVHRRGPLRGCGARLRAVADAAAGGTGGDHRVSAADARVGQRDAGRYETHQRSEARAPRVCPLCEAPIIKPTGPPVNRLTSSHEHSACHASRGQLYQSADLESQ